MPRVLPTAARYLALAALITGGTVVMTASPERAEWSHVAAEREGRAGSSSSTASRSRAGKDSRRRSPAPAGRPLMACCTREADGGDLLTVEEFGDFELRLEWKLAKGRQQRHLLPRDQARATRRGSRVQSSRSSTTPAIRTARTRLTSAGSNYAVHAPVRDVTKPIGEWNNVRLIVHGAHVEHWMNGVKLLEYELWSPDWETRVKASKFGKIPMLRPQPSAGTSRSRTTGTRCGTAISRYGRCSPAVRAVSAVEPVVSRELTWQLKLTLSSQRPPSDIPSSETRSRSRCS